jgi:hypothetical protein
MAGKIGLTAADSGAGNRIISCLGKTSSSKREGENDKGAQQRKSERRLHWVFSWEGLNPELLERCHDTLFCSALQWRNCKKQVKKFIFLR